MLNLKKAALVGAMAVGSVLSGGNAMSADYPTRPCESGWCRCTWWRCDHGPLHQQEAGRQTRPAGDRGKQAWRWRGDRHRGRGACRFHRMLLFTSVAHAINPGFYPNLQFDSVKDFAPVAAVATAPNGIAARADAPFNTLAKYGHAGRQPLTS